MKQESGMATLWTASSLIFITSLLAWMTLQSVMSETQRSQHQLYAAQALAVSESLLETSIAQIDSIYTGQDIAIDSAFWRNASQNQCPSSHALMQWQCLKWTGAGLGLFDKHIAELTWPESIDTADSFVLFIRNVKLAPHKVKIWVQVSLNAKQPGHGSRATVQQSVYIPISSPWIPPVLEPAPPTNTSACVPVDWRKLFGNTTPAQLKAISEAQSQNGLTSQTQTTRSVYWIDSPQTWTQSLGSQSAPVVLIFSANACAVQCPQIANSAAITGMVYFQSANACQNPVPQLSVNFEAHHFEWPNGIDARRVQRVSGSWKNGGF
jgi:hypothetical protein